MMEQNPVSFADIDEALADFDENDDPILVRQPLPPGHEMEKFYSHCKWLYLSVHNKHKIGLFSKPGPHEEFILVWTYESFSILREAHNAWGNFFLLREISYGLDDAFDQKPRVKLGMIKKEDIAWLQQINKPSPESKRFFAKEICYERKRNEFSQPFGGNLGDDVRFWAYITKYPFWDPVPEFFSEKHNGYRNFRVYSGDVILEKIWELICDFECLRTGAKVQIKDGFLKKMGLQEISSWDPKALFHPRLGDQWKNTCVKFALRLPGYNS